MGNGEDDVKEIASTKKHMKDQGKDGKTVIKVDWEI
jgi:hypothetical protein